MKKQKEILLKIVSKLENLLEVAQRRRDSYIYKIILNYGDLILINKFKKILDYLLIMDFHQVKAKGNLTKNSSQIREQARRCLMQARLLYIYKINLNYSDLILINKF